MTDIGAEFSNESLPKPPETPDNIGEIAAQGLAVLHTGIYFPDNLYSIMEDRSREGPIASASLIATRLESGENLPTDDELQTTDELKAQLRRAIFSGGFLTRNEAERLYGEVTSDEATGMRILKQTVSNAQDANEALQEHGSRSSGRVYKYSCGVIGPLVQLLHPRLHKK